MRSVWPLRLLWLAGLLLVAGCTTIAAVPSSLPPRDQLRDFALEARFILHQERLHESPQSASGRLSWQHTENRDSILIATPLGQGIAEIEATPIGAHLRTSDGRQYAATDPAALLEEATGYPLPLGDLPAWLLGRPSVSGRFQADTTGRPQRLFEADWQIDYDYDDVAAGALPSRLTLQRGNQLELRLRIEEWRDLP